MTPLTFRVIREGLGLTTSDAADRLSIAQRTIDRWEAGATPIPPFAQQALAEWEARAAQTVKWWVESLDGDPSPKIVLTDGPDDEPLRWQRAIAFRVRLQLPDLIVCEAPE